MALEFKKTDQETVTKVATDFISYYYENLNIKNYNNITPYLKKFTWASMNKTRYNGDNLLSYYKIFNDIGANFSNIDFDTLHSGAKRINILVTGVINFKNENGEMNSKNFSEYIHCGTSKEGEFWIQTIIFKLI